jgi:predicted ATPase
VRLGRAHRYHGRVFLAPPWPEIYQADPERRHGFEEAAEEHYRLESAYAALGYEVVALPRTNVERRAAFIVEMLGRARG